MWSIEKWDGLAKIGKFSAKEKSIITPALFPVVDPFKKEVSIDELKNKFGFDQVISSAYLMSKRMGEKKISEYPKMHDYLNFDGLIMMDSGAYQVMLYGDIDLGVLDTLELQYQVETDVGVIMDHPIGFSVNHDDAKMRVENTISNIKQSLPTLKEFNNISWTLPIQGGKYLDLMDAYLDVVLKPEIRDQFSFYALGSVVQVMIQQRYDLLVDMIAHARSRLPVDKPLHLFGAGHPAMFALATFLGCDTFDSAAYILMAKEGRYMTVEGTYQLNQLKEFPCYCPVCSQYVPVDVKKMKHKMRTKIIAEHNLYVSNGEIMRVRNAIRFGRLWDLVQQRAAAVPNLAIATRKAVEYVTEGKLKQLYMEGIPVYNATAIRMMRDIDVKKVEITRVGEQASKLLLELQPKKIVCLGYLMDKSIYNKSSSRLLEFALNDELIALYLPPFGIVPARIFDTYPIGQLEHDLELDAFDSTKVIDQVSQLVKNGLESLTLIISEQWPADYFVNLEKIVPKLHIIHSHDPLKYLTTEYIQ